MIAGKWHGSTTPENADAYDAVLKPEVLPGISRVKGFRGSYFLRRELGSEVEFVVDEFRLRADRLCSDDNEPSHALRGRTAEGSRP